jgi:glutamate-1-semialdehyde 2,1-aminomutase
MTSTDIGAALHRVSKEYLDRNPRSMEMADRAARVLPGGTTRTTTFFAPFPPVLVAGEGSEIVDADGNRRVDYLNNYTSLVLGHAHPDVLSRAMAAAGRGTAFSSPTEYEVRLAEVLVERVASVDQIRFTNSGTEATMAAMRLARAFTGRPKVARFQGSYHGTHDYTTTPGAGIPDPVDDLMVTLPFNDIAGCEEAIDQVADSLAAVIIEPILGAGGVIAADQEFLDFLRQATVRTGALLIFDEIITFRLHAGGAQATYGIRPDLTTFGKIIGGGFPIGGFGGREDVMALLHPTSGSIPWGGTFNGNPVSAAAGIETLEALTSPVIDELNRAGEELVKRIEKALEVAGLPARVTGAGSLFNLHATGEEITDSRAVGRSDPELTELLHLGLMNRGYFLAPRGMGCLSTAMTTDELDGLVDAVEDLVNSL